MPTQTKTLNLTPAFVVWTLIFVIVAFVTDNLDWLWLAAAPWLIGLGLMVLFTVLGGAFFALWYYQGKPVTIRVGGNKRVVQRGRKTRYL